MESISRVRQQAATNPVEASVACQVESCGLKTTRDGKPYRELTLADATDHLTLRIWSDHPAYRSSETLAAGDFLCIDGEFSLNGTFGLEAKRWKLRPLTPDEIAPILEGPAEMRAKQEADFATISSTVESLADPRLRALCLLFLAEHGPRFRRTAAARTYHHARRGGLVEHVSQMMRAADAIAAVYPQLNRDLLLTGTLFHDCGKLWENAVEEKGFAMPYSMTGEMLGHIALGIEVTNALWRKMLESDKAKAWPKMEPPNEEVRLHLLHLIASHHGELEFGSPIVPKTPEAAALHYIDNLDAKLEMFDAGYRSAAQLAPGIQERVRPLTGNLVRPLRPFAPPAARDPENPDAQS